MDNKTRLRRLRHFVDVLTKVQDNKFDLGVWSTAGPLSPGRGYFDLKDLARGKECGTVACALGWACFDPEFYKEGLRLSFGGVPVFSNEEGTFGGQLFFGISMSEAYDLFYPYFYPNPDSVTKEQAIHKIQKLIIKYDDGRP